MKTNKEELIKEHKNKPYEVGENVLVKGLGSQNPNSWFGSTNIVEVHSDGVSISEYGHLKKKSFDDIKRSTYDVGYNPFPRVNYDEEPRAVSFQLSSIIFQLTERTVYPTEKGFDIQRANFNPFVEINGKKEYYQRGFVWGLDDKQLLLESIFNGINCGSIIIRKRSLEWNRKQERPEDTGFYDIVDGKQRLSAILEFINDGFPDKNGYFYSDYSFRAQNDLVEHQLFNYSEFGETAKDESIIRQFLKVNFSGIPQSKEHIKFVQEIYNKF